ncbi:imidazole glycerol phosphate synthase cyclase subunit [Solidesulfovibrio sp.]|uniref:imidazole glycerol phosphate synthase subunit HisF n=1 Tax=Solidesulfovibrio sp. TaxID=2910990 RepID=UPI002B21F36B|nr:imidazole glycerol phosphate synthase cyclase subunit [Solidesulfovibrio sp.]MEA5090919.1 imidazole glycerol phosphate synthase cyclase subunit [Solidesulfovibrio sp.]
MLKTRLIPVLLLMDGALVRSEQFRTHQIIGNPIHEVERFNEWNVDELIYLDISRKPYCGGRRDDQKVRGVTSHLDILDAVSRTCFMPLTWGGGIRSIEEMRERFARGADKITVNTAAHDDLGLVTRAAKAYGSQAVVVSIDVLRRPDGSPEVVTAMGTRPTGLDPASWARCVQEAGAGEILLQCVDRDGTGAGYDLEVVSMVAAATRIPVIALSGVGRFEDYAAAVTAGAAAVAAANIWHFKELSDRQGKRALSRAGIETRLPPGRKGR